MNSKFCPIAISILGAVFVTALLRADSPPTSEVNPATLSEVEVLVPTKFKVGRTDDTLIVSDDNNSLKPVKFKVGPKMSLGMRTESFVFPVGSPHPANPGSIGLQGVPVHKPGTPLTNSGSSSSLYHRQSNGYPVPGTSYEVELKISIFETDKPPQHMWMPESPKYKVLWKTTLHQTVK
jgi:hypothetical protein